MPKVLILLGALVLPAFAGAQASLTDPSAPVPVVRYRSVFADTPTGVETESVDWRAANAEVGQFRNGHMDILKWEDNQARQQTAVPMAPHSGAHARPPTPPTAKP